MAAALETIRDRMLAGARRGARALGPDAKRAARFLLARQRPEGGFAGRDDRCDLYYTTFALQALCALEQPLPPGLAQYISSQQPASDDLVQVSCLVRCLSLLGPIDARRSGALAGQVAGFRSGDGGFATAPHSPACSAYGCFLAMAALQDLGEPVEAGPLVELVRTLRCPGGGYANFLDVPVGLVPASAAALEVLRVVGQDDADARQWLERCLTPDGGLCAAEGLEQADLLSTAVGLHAGASLPPAQRDATEAFVRNLQQPDGGFGAGQADPTPDCEYTFYALLAMEYVA